jgi:serine/threonine-protein kinase RsbT
MNFLAALEELLGRHVAPKSARLVVERSRRALGHPTQLTREDRARFLLTVRATLRLFVSDDKAAALVEEIDQQLLPKSGRIERDQLKFEIVHEEDLRAARAGARELCLAFSASSFDAQRVATAVSELSRNIVAYTPGGELEVRVYRGPPLRVAISAHDRGTGIANLDEVLSGRYRSKTGLGRGLIGVKRLMQRFHVETGPSGTRIEAEVTLS